MQLHDRSFGGFRLSQKPPTRWDEGSSSRCSRRKREAQSCQPISTAVQQYSLTPTASRKTTKTIKSTRLTIRRRTRRFQSKKSPVEKGRFRLAESDCVRIGLRSLFSRNVFVSDARAAPCRATILIIMLLGTKNTSSFFYIFTLRYQNDLFFSLNVITFSLAPVGLFSHFWLQSTQGPSVFTPHVWAPAELRGLCCGHSKSRSWLFFNGLRSA